MSDTESQIFRTAYRFLTNHTPPSSASVASVAWWMDTAKEIGALSAQYQHPLMDGLLVAIYEYLQSKAKEMVA